MKSDEYEIGEIVRNLHWLQDLIPTENRGWNGKNTSKSMTLCGSDNAGLYTIITFFHLSSLRDQTYLVR